MIVLQVPWDECDERNERERAQLEFEPQTINYVAQNYTECKKNEQIHGAIHDQHCIRKAAIARGTRVRAQLESRNESKRAKERESMCERKKEKRKCKAYTARR